MKKLFICFILLEALIFNISADSPTAPIPPPVAQDLMPEQTENFGSGLEEMGSRALNLLHPDLMEAGRIGLTLIAATMIISILQSFSPPIERTIDLVGTAVIAGNLLLTSNAMIALARNTIKELSDYGKLLIPVMTGALAAQGGITKSTAIYAGTLGFTSVLGSLISSLLLPMTYLFLALSIGNSALGEDVFKKLKDLVKSLVAWVLKTVTLLFTGYISLTGVVSGTADAAALKAAKTAVSAAVPVVGSILSNASETMLVSMALLKNSAGLYGIFAILAIFIEPFLQILAHYWILKISGAVCSVFGSGNTSALIGDFSGAMGLLLAMTGTICLLLLIGTVCFMKGVI